MSPAMVRVTAALGRPSPSKVKLVGFALRLTPLGRWNLEGPRKVALVFTLSVALKWLLSLGVSDRLVDRCQRLGYRPDGALVG